MVFTLKENSISGTTLLQTSSTLYNNRAPEIFFGKNSFKLIDTGRWVKNRAVNREGDFVHYTGSDNGKMSMEIYLHGANRNTNLEIVRGLKSKIIYLDASDRNSNLSGLYVVSSTISSEDDEKKQLTKCTMEWERYNN